MRHLILVSVALLSIIPAAKAELSGNALLELCAGEGQWAAYPREATLTTCVAHFLGFIDGYETRAYEQHQKSEAFSSALREKKEESPDQQKNLAFYDALVAPKTYTPTFCKNPGVTPNQLVLMVKKQASEHPEYLSTNHVAITLPVALALHRCK